MTMLSTNRRSLTVAVLACTAALSLTHAFAQPAQEGWFGIEIKATPKKGSLANPVVESVTLTKVVPGSPAAQKGLAVGDQVMEIEGVAIAGRKPTELQRLAQKSVGQSMRLRLKKTNGRSYAVVMVGVARPK
jgi:C-terminal processing protease CtpA/Prc